VLIPRDTNIRDEALADRPAPIHFRTKSAVYDPARVFKLIQPLKEDKITDKNKKRRRAGACID
jgi:hypothetical protein